MYAIDLSRAKWRKSRHSSQDGNCVEVASNLPGLVAVRDSKNPGMTAMLLPRKAWLEFIHSGILRPQPVDRR